MTCGSVSHDVVQVWESDLLATEQVEQGQTNRLGEGEHEQGISQS